MLLLLWYSRFSILNNLRTYLLTTGMQSIPECLPYTATIVINNAVYNQYIFVKVDCLKLLQLGS